MRRIAVLSIILIAVLFSCGAKHPYWPVAVVGGPNQAWFADSLNALHNGFRYIYCATDPKGTGKYQQIITLTSREWTEADTAPAARNSGTSRIRTQYVDRIYRTSIMAPDTIHLTDACFDYLDSAAVGKAQKIATDWNTPYTTERIYHCDIIFDASSANADSVQKVVWQAIRYGAATGVMIETQQRNNFTYTPLTGAYRTKMDTIEARLERWGAKLVYTGTTRSSKVTGRSGTGVGYYDGETGRIIGKDMVSVPTYRNLSPAIPDTFKFPTSVGDSFYVTSSSSQFKSSCERTSDGNRCDVLTTTGNSPITQADTFRVYKVKFQARADVSTPTSLYTVRWHRNGACVTGLQPQQAQAEAAQVREIRSKAPSAGTAWAWDSMYVNTLETRCWKVYFWAQTGKVWFRDLMVYECLPPENAWVPEAYLGYTPPSGRGLYICPSITDWDGAEDARPEIQALRDSVTHLQGHQFTDESTHRCVSGWEIMSDELKNFYWDTPTKTAYSSAGAAYADYIGDMAESAYNITGQPNWCYVFHDMFFSQHDGTYYPRGAINPAGGGMNTARAALASRKNYVTMVSWGMDSQAKAQAFPTEFAGWNWVYGIENYDDHRLTSQTSLAKLYAGDSIRTHGICYLGWAGYHVRASADTMKRDWYKGFDISTPAGDAIAAINNLWLFNVNATRDQDGDGTTDARETMDYYLAAHPGTKVCSLYTKDITEASLNQDNNANEMMYWDYFAYDFDTDSVMGYDAAVTLPENCHYIVDDIDNTLTANSWWNIVKVITIGPGIALQLSGDSRCMDDEAFLGKRKSLDDALMIFLEEGVGTHGHITAKGIPYINVSIWSNPWTGNAALDFRTARGTLTSSRQFYGGMCKTSWGGTCQPRFITCRINAPTQDLINGMIDKATATPPISYADGVWTTTGWAVVDQDSNGSAGTYNLPWYWAAYPSAMSDTFRQSLVDLFGYAQILRDSAGCTAGNNPDNYEQQLGVGAAQTLTSPDSALFYFGLHRFNTPQQGSDVIYNLTFPVKTGAAYVQWASFGCVTVLDSVGRSDNQPLLVDAIRMGFTYGIGSANEPAGSAAPKFWNFANLMKYPGTTFAEAALGTTGYLGATVRLGDPLGVWVQEP